MKSADYERIKKIIGNIYEENSDFLIDVPIDVFKLAQKMGFKLIRASERLKLGIHKVIEYQEINANKNVFGLTFFDIKQNCYVVYFDDVNAGEMKQRFSVAHEIGHITLGHVDKNCENSLEAEREANYFAGYLMFPECLSNNNIIFEKLFNNIELIKRLFGLADDTAIIKNRHLYNRHSLLDTYYYEYEKNICNCLEEAVLTKIRD